MNPVTQLEQSLTHLNTPAVVQGFRTYPMALAPTTTTVPTGFSSGALLSTPVLLIGVFGVSLLAVIAGSGTVRTLGVVGMLGSVGFFLAGVSQIH